MGPSLLLPRQTKGYTPGAAVCLTLTWAVMRGNQLLGLCDLRQPCNQELGTPVEPASLGGQHTCQPLSVHTQTQAANQSISGRAPPRTTCLRSPCFPRPCPFTTFLASVHFHSVTQSCPTLCDPMNRSTPGLPVHHQLPEFTQTHVH